MEGVVMNSNFWKDKKVFLTGHTGFKGSWLSLWLQQAGAKVTGYALPPPTDPSLFDIARVSEGMDSVIGDIRDRAELASSMRLAAPEIVIHMAAQPLVRRSYVDPVETYSTNVLGTVHLLEAVRQTDSVRAVVNVTTDKCYENREWAWGYRENEAMGGFDPYSSSKGCAELVTAAYRRSFFESKGSPHSHVALASARAGNVIGGGDWAEDRLVPDILRAMQCGIPVSIRNPHSIRPWQHVLEPLSGYLALAERLYTVGSAYADAFNFGPSDADARSVEWIVQRLTKQWAGSASWRLDGGDHPHEAHYLKLDCSKASSVLNWHPRWSLETALDAIVTWHKAYLQGDDMRKMCLQQISDFSTVS